MATLEYRKLIRANIAIKIVYKSVKRQLSGIAFSKDISSTGINIIMADKLEKANELEIQIYLSEDEKPIFAKGKIIWQARCSYAPQSKKQYYSTGIQFTHMSNDDAIKTSDFVKNALKQQSDTEIRRIIERIEKTKKP